MNKLYTHQESTPDATGAILTRIEQLSHELSLFYVFEQWEIYYFNGWVAYPIQPIALSSPYAPELEHLEQGMGLFWTKKDGYLFPFMPDLVLACLHQKDIETLPFSSEVRL